MRRYLPVNIDLALLILRLVLAAVLLYHGLPKLLNFGAAVGAFQSMNIPAPSVTAGFALISEVVGGILILLGIAVDIAAILVVIDMLGAIALVHWANGFDFTKGGWEHPFTVLGAALALAWPDQAGIPSSAPTRVPSGGGFEGRRRRRQGWKGTVILSQAKDLLIRRP